MMKKIIITLFIVSTLSCKAQSNIKSLDGDGSCPPYDTNCYEKDVNNEFDKFIGNWKYVDANNEITFMLKKEAHYQLDSNSNYEDLLTGEYQYIENGVELANTLIDFNNSNITGYSHKLFGGIYIRKYSYFDTCTGDSNTSDVKVHIYINHPTNSGPHGNVIMRYFNDNGVEKIEACIYDETVSGDGTRTIIPDGQYTFIKQ